MERCHGDATCMPHRERLAAVGITGGSGRQVTTRSVVQGQSACKDIEKRDSLGSQPQDGGGTLRFPKGRLITLNSRSSIILACGRSLFFMFWDSCEVCIS